ncbi:MAG TPA: DUF1080 domain-containing protein, partial [Bryobacteraceae bacterium]
MKSLCVALTLAAAVLLPVRAQTGKNPFSGRWDLTVTTARGTANQWMEIVENGGKLDGRIQPGGGAVRPIVGAKMDGARLVVTVAPAAKGPETIWELTAEGNKITGVQKHGDTTDAQIAGDRAPELNRPMPKAWSAPESLFNGKDLTGWEPVNNPDRSKWVVEDGTLYNQDRGSNIRTTRKFEDFKLHIEVNCPEHCNSGIYLRGRYEVQVEYEPVDANDKFHSIGAIYSMVAPSVDLPRKPGTWESFDI